MLEHLYSHFELILFTAGTESYLQTVMALFRKTFEKEYFAYGLSRKYCIDMKRP